MYLIGTMASSKYKRSRGTELEQSIILCINTSSTCSSCSISTFVIPYHTYELESILDIKCKSTRVGYFEVLSLKPILKVIRRYGPLCGPIFRFGPNNLLLMLVFLIFGHFVSNLNKKNLIVTYNFSKELVKYTKKLCQ